MTKDEAIHKALKVLNCLNNDRVYETAWVKGAINACEEALDLSEKKYTFPDKNIQAQEPVAWQWLKSGHMRKKIPKTATPEHWRPLYTHPHQCQECKNLKHDLEGYMEANKALVNKQWQGLTDNEIARLVLINEVDKSGDTGFARLIEQALKEKNHGT
jgi:hypothetical protein